METTRWPCRFSSEHQLQQWAFITPQERESLAAPSKPKEWRASPLYIICIRHFENCSMHLLDHGGFKAPGALRWACRYDAKLVAQDPAGCSGKLRCARRAVGANLRIFLHCSSTAKVTWNHLCSLSLVSLWCLLEIFYNTTKSKLRNFFVCQCPLRLLRLPGKSHGDSIMTVRPMRKIFFSNAEIHSYDVSSLCWLLWENKSIHKRAPMNLLWTSSPESP